MARASPKCWRLWHNWAALHRSLCCPLFKDAEATIWFQASINLKNPSNSNAPTASHAAVLPVESPGLLQSQASASLRGPFMPSKPGKLSHINKYRCKHKIKPWSSQPQHLCPDLWKHFPEDFTLMMLLISLL